MDRTNISTVFVRTVSASDFLICMVALLTAALYLRFAILKFDANAAQLQNLITQASFLTANPTDGLDAQSNDAIKSWNKALELAKTSGQPDIVLADIKSGLGQALENNGRTDDSDDQRLEAATVYRHHQMDFEEMDLLKKVIGNQGWLWQDDQQLYGGFTKHLVDKYYPVISELTHQEERYAPPTDLDFYNHKKTAASMMVYMGRPEWAEAVFKKLVGSRSADDDDFDLYRRDGDCLKRMGKLSEAANWYDQAYLYVQKDPGQMEVRQTIAKEYAHILQLQGKHKEAAKILSDSQKQARPFIAAVNTFGTLTRTLYVAEPASHPPMRAATNGIISVYPSTAGGDAFAASDVQRREPIGY